MSHVFDDTFRAELALEIARMVKEHAPRAVVILGGSHEDGTNPRGDGRGRDEGYRENLPPEPDKDDLHPRFRPANPAKKSLDRQL